MKTFHNKRSSRSKKQSVPVEGTSTLPNHLKKEGCIYINGIIDSGAHGFYHVNLENKMNDYLQFVNGKMPKPWLGRNDETSSFLQFPIDDVHWPPYSNSSSDEDKKVQLRKYPRTLQRGAGTYIFR